MTTISEPLCTKCYHFISAANKKPRCNAFPKGIPKLIWEGKKQHDKVYKKQKNDFVFALLVESVQPPIRIQTSERYNSFSGVIGFENINDAKKYAEENNGYVAWFCLPNSDKVWSKVWENLGPLDKPIPCWHYLHDLGEDYTVYDGKKDSPYFNQLLSLAVNTPLFSIERVFETIENIKEIIQKYDNCDAENQIIIVYKGKFFEVCDKLMMSYTADGSTVVVGVADNEEFDIDNFYD